MTETNALIRLDAARRALELASSIEEVKAGRDQMEVMREYAKKQRWDLDSQNQCAERKLWHEHRLGEMLAAPDGLRRKGQRDEIFHDEGFAPPKLSDLGISESQSHRWQAIATIPKAHLEAAIASVKAKREELTSRDMYRLARQLERSQRGIIEAAPMPEGPFRCIVIDPPWPMEKIEREVRPNQGLVLDYPVMSLEEIAALPIPDRAEPTGCHIYLWVTQKYLPAGLQLFKTWDVAYQCLLTWVKPTGMTPYSWMYNTEHVLFGRIGSLPLDRLGLKLSFEAPALRHSQKPDIFYERVRQASPGPRSDMFAREPHEGFTAWGNEV